MRKLVLAGLLLTTFLGVSAYGQRTTERGNRPERPKQVRQERPRQERPRIVRPRIQENRHRFPDRIFSDMPYTSRDEYRYVKYKGEVYREVYRCSYARGGLLIRREFIRREKVRNRPGIRFNIYIPL